MSLATIATGIEIWVLFNALVLAVLVYCANERDRREHSCSDQADQHPFKYPHLVYSENTGDAK